MSDMILNKKVESMGDYDVLVAGGGAAGICAAISAGRAGARVALAERYGIVGGGLTSGGIGPIMGGTGAGTVNEEIHKRLGIVPREAHNFETAKIELSLMLREAGVDVYLQCAAGDAILEGNRIKGLVFATAQGLRALTAKVVVDATGDGTAAYLAGAPFRVGRDEDSLVQPVSLMFVLGNVAKEAIYCQGVHPDAKVPSGDFVEICREACRNRELPPNVDTVRIYHTGSETERMINATQVNYVNPLCPKELSQSEAAARAQIKTVHEFLKKVAPGYENSYIKSSSSTIGVRESRRVLGEYVLTDEDVETGKKFEDAVVHSANFLIDIHNPSGGGQAEGVSKHVRAYDIPLRCLVPLEVEGLLVAGRAISGTHRAHASYRVMNICMPMGQAAGIAAALCAKDGILPRKLDYHRVQSELTALGVDLFSDTDYEYPFNPSN